MAIASWAPPTQPLRSAAPVGYRPWRRPRCAHGVPTVCPRCAHSASYRYRHCRGAIHTDRLRFVCPRMTFINPVRRLKNPRAPNPDDTSSTLPLVGVEDCTGGGGGGANGRGDASKPRFISFYLPSVREPASCSLQASAICVRALIMHSSPGLAS